MFITRIVPHCTTQSPLAGSARAGCSATDGWSIWTWSSASETANRRDLTWWNTRSTISPYSAPQSTHCMCLCWIWSCCPWWWCRKGGWPRLNTVMSSSIAWWGGSPRQEWSCWCRSVVPGTARWRSHWWPWSWCLAHCSLFGRSSGSCRSQRRLAR